MSTAQSKRNIPSGSGNRLRAPEPLKSEDRNSSRKKGMLDSHDFLTRQEGECRKIDCARKPELMRSGSRNGKSGGKSIFRIEPCGGANTKKVHRVLKGTQYAGTEANIISDRNNWKKEGR